MQTSLSALLPGQSGTVTNVGGAAGIRHRLLEMGLTVGTAVQLVRTAPFGGPIELELRGYRLSMRRTEAEHILVEGR